MAARKAVFLDRDGVINHSAVRDGKAYAPRSLAEFQLLPGVKEAAEALSAAGYLLIVVTNQPDIGNGLVDRAIVDEMHQHLLQQLPIAKIYLCPHRQNEGCECRKPKPGMLLAAKAEFGIDMAASYMIGDRYSDVCAGIAAGCTPVFIDYDYIETPDFDVKMRVQSLSQASQIILKGCDA